jgi:hypothetical protein
VAHDDLLWGTQSGMRGDRVSVLCVRSSTLVACLRYWRRPAFIPTGAQRLAFNCSEEAPPPAPVADPRYRENGKRP